MADNKEQKAEVSITGVRARQIYDSRGNPTIEVDVTTQEGQFRACVPSGASTGIYEALELRDKVKEQHHGKGVLKAVKNVNEVIGPKLIGRDPRGQAEIDKLMVEELDGSKNEWGWSKSKLGANAILGVSLAVARAGAMASKRTLYEYIGQLAGRADGQKWVLPVPAFNVINGGSHAGNALAFQECMMLPTGAGTFREAMQIGSEVYQELKKVIKAKYGQDAVNVGDEGGFAPNIADQNEAFRLVAVAVQNCGYAEKVEFATDVAASEFYNEALKKYDLGKWQSGDEKKAEKLDAPQMVELFEKMAGEHNVCSVEDAFDQDDWEAWAQLTAKVGERVQVVGDDLLVTNTKRMAKAVETKACNALLLKVNQIGSLSEAIAAVQMAQTAGWGVMTSHRSGETEDTFIADLAVGLTTGQIKTGAPCRSERMAKYNQLLRIEEELGDRAIFAGKLFRTPQKALK